MDNTKQGISNEAFELESEGNHISDSKTLPDTQTALFENNLSSFDDSHTKTVDKCLRDESNEAKTNGESERDTLLKIEIEYLRDGLDSTDELKHNADGVSIVEVKFDNDVRKHGIEITGINSLERQDAGNEYYTTKDFTRNNKKHDGFNKEDSEEIVKNNNESNDALKFILEPVENFKKFNNENKLKAMENENVNIAEQKYVFKELTSKEEGPEVFCYKFTGPLFRSLNEKSAKKSWRRRSLREELKSMIL